MMSAIVKVKWSIEALLKDTPGVLKVQVVLAPAGPEIHVTVEKVAHRKIRKLLPEQRSGYPIVVKVARADSL